MYQEWAGAGRHAGSVPLFGLQSTAQVYRRRGGPQLNSTELTSQQLRQVNPDTYVSQLYPVHACFFTDVATRGSIFEEI